MDTDPGRSGRQGPTSAELEAALAGLDPEEAASIRARARWTWLAAYESSELVGERALPHQSELAVCACQRCVQLRRPPEVLGEGFRLYHHDCVELKSTCLLRVIEANLKSIPRPDEPFSS